jgi:hypothetical protein
VKECIVPDFLELDGFADQLTGYDACSYCAGASSRGMSEAEYSHVTYDVTTHFARSQHLDGKISNRITRPSVGSIRYCVCCFQTK